MEWKPTDVTILFIYCWISTSFGPTGPSSGEFVQLFTQPLVQFLCRSVRVLCVLRTERHRNWTNGCVNSCTNSPEDGPVGPKHVEIQQYMNKIVTSVGFHSICWKDARYKKLKIQCWNIYFKLKIMLLSFSDDFILYRKTKRNKDFVVFFQVFLHLFRRYSLTTHVCEHWTSDTSIWVTCSVFLEHVGENKHFCLFFYICTVHSRYEDFFIKIQLMLHSL